MTGEGKMKYRNGCVYNGHWRYWKRHGIGTYRTNNGIEYEGHFRDGEMCGKVKVTDPTGQTFEGELLMGLRNGEGRVEVESENIVLKGRWWNDRLVGNATIETKTFTYVGDVVETIYDNERRGYKISGRGEDFAVTCTVNESGKTVRQKGYPRYEGCFYEGKKNGYGTLWQSPTKYYRFGHTPPCPQSYFHFP